MATAKQSYVVGWNDTVYGLNTCTSGPQTVAYIAEMRKAARKVPTPYAKGALAVLEKALATGNIPERLT